jgi:hypothetical protein
MLDWQPISTAPYDRDLELAVVSQGEVHALVFPSRRTPVGWVDAETARRIEVYLDLLADDLQRQLYASCDIQRSARRNGRLIPIIVTNRISGTETWLALASPIAPGVPTEQSVRSYCHRLSASMICLSAEICLLPPSKLYQAFHN